MKHGFGIAGISGRMGRMLVEEMAAAGAPLAGGIDPAGSTSDAPLFSDMTGLAAEAALVIDFTHASTVREHARVLARAGTSWVLGTTGLSAADEAEVTEASKKIAIVYAPNYSAGVTLMLALAERMAAALPAAVYDAEIVEMHHRQKVDAPSGTAIGLGRAVARGRDVVLENVMQSGRQGHTGARVEGQIGFAALRGGQVVGEHTLLFAAGDEHIALTHRAFDRRVFATGAVRAAIWLQTKPAGLYSMFDVLGLS